MYGCNPAKGICPTNSRAVFAVSRMDGSERSNVCGQHLAGTVLAKAKNGYPDDIWVRVIDLSPILSGDPA